MISTSELKITLSTQAPSSEIIKNINQTDHSVSVNMWTHSYIKAYLLYGEHSNVSGSHGAIAFLVTMNRINDAIIKKIIRVIKVKASK